MRNPIGWKDHVVEHPNRYEEKNVGEGLVELVKSPGEVVQQGTPMNAKNFNAMDLMATQAVLMSSANARYIAGLQQKTDGLEGEVIQVTLQNTQKYPFNNSRKAVQLVKKRNNKNYFVTAELVSKTGGCIGNIQVTDKLLNGFKIEFTGSASQVVLNCIIRGGM